MFLLSILVLLTGSLFTAVVLWLFNIVVSMAAAATSVAGVAAVAVETAAAAATASAREANSATRIKLNAPQTTMLL